MRLTKTIGWSLAMGAGALLCAPGATAQISLASAVDLALQNSPKIRIASADVQRAEAGLAETKDAYVPNFVLGSGVGYTYGFPVGQPSIFNVTSESLLYSFSQPSYVRAARAALKSAELNLDDNKDAVTLDCALAYLQLNTDVAELASLDREKDAAETLVTIERQRLAAGVASRMDETNAEITAAQIDLKRLNLQDDADAQRRKLAHLTGMPAASFLPTNSIPPFPDFSQDTTLAATALAENSGIKAAASNAKSKLELSFGDSRRNYWPQFGFGVEYNRYAEFNNYQEYYRRFQHNNFNVGIQITVPLFDAGVKAKARQSAAEAVRARAQAEQAKNETNEQVESLQHDLKELRAQMHLAQLQDTLAGEKLQAVKDQLSSAGGPPNSAPASPRDEQLASIQLEERHLDVLKANFSVMRAQLALMRSLGSIQKWVHLPVN
ncbi:MAG TPA: TolC family protein [Acidobacteriaceae bacterium]|nr:TolC family protein [Acidobacteriaceae bacterium]